MELAKTKKEFEEQKIMPRIMKSGSISSDSVNSSLNIAAITPQTIKVIRKKSRAQSIQPKSMTTNVDNEIEENVLSSSTS